MKRILWKYIGILFISIGLVIFCGIFLFTSSLRLIQEAITSSSYAQMQTVQKEIDGRMREITSMLAQLSSDPDLSFFAREDNPLNKLTNIYNFNQFNQKLATYTASNQFVESIYVHLRYNDTVFTNNRFFLSLEDAYDAYFQYGSFSLNEWNELCYQQYYYQALLNDYTPDHSLSSLYYIQSIPNGAPTANGVIVVSFPKEDLLFSLKKIAETYGGYGFIMDDNQVVAATAPDVAPTSSSSDELQITVHSDYNNWTFLLQIPKSNLMKQVVSFRNMGILLLFAAVVLCVIILKSFFGKKAAIVGKILSNFQYGSNSAKTDEFSFIQTSIDRVLLHNTTLEQKIELYKPQILDEFWRKLLNGQILTFEKAQYYLMQMGEIPLDGSFCVIVLQIRDLPVELKLEDIENINQMKVYIRQNMAALLTGYIAASDTGIQNIAIISSTTDDAELNAALEIVQNDFEKQFRYPLSYGYGRIVDSLFDLSLSYMDALEHMKPISAALPQQYLHNAYVATSQMQQIIQAMKCESYDIVAQYTDSLYRVCLNQPETPPWSFSQFINSLLSCVLTVCSDMKPLVVFPEEKLSGLIAGIYNSHHFSEQYQYIKDMQREVCHAIQAAKQERSNNTLLEIQAYIEQNICQYTLSLESVAEHFHLSEAYLSSYFKERSGENFSTWVERIRIEKACAQLSSSDASINDIAQKTGYSSAAVFRRAFKRVKGISPSEYIISLRKKEEKSHE